VQDKGELPQLRQEEPHHTECPERKQTYNQEHIQVNIQEDGGNKDDINEGENIFMQKSVKGVVNKNWLLLDSQSTVDQVANPVLLKNIRKVASAVTVHCNARSTSTNLEGDLGDVTVKHNSHSIANVVLLHETKQRHRVMYNSWDQGRVFQVHTDGGIVEFKPSSRRLHYHDVSDPSSNLELMLVNTVRENFEGYTRQDVERAREARRIQAMIANPTKREFAGMVHDKLLTNCPITVRDVDDGNQFFGPNLANLRGNTTRAKLDHVRVEYARIPKDFIQLQQYMTLVTDVMFVNRLPFLVMSMWGISLVTIEHLPSQTAKCLVHTLE
jgi:hypothetical protein